MLESRALYALSLYVAGMTVMRLLIGSVFRLVKLPVLMFSSLAMVFIGIIVLYFWQSYYLSITGLILLGIGLAAGFPIMLGMAGNRYKAQSGAAFSIIFTVALCGNMLVNYLMGLISKNFGIQHFITVAFGELVFMFALCILVFRSQKTPDTETEAITEIKKVTI